MRYIVIGAGAIGCSVGGRLHESGHEVVLVARGEHGDALRADGLELITPDQRLRLRVPVVSGPAEVRLRPDDVLVLAVKTQDSVAALDAWCGEPVLGGGTAGERLPVLCAQNGVANERLALRRFRQVLAACVVLPSTFLTPGRVVAPCAPLTGLLPLGRYPSGVDRTCELVAADLAESRMSAPVFADVMRWKYAKLLGNLGNAVEAVCGRRSPALVALARQEADRVLTAAGIDRASEAEFARLQGDSVTVRPIDGVDRGLGSSWQSVVRGKTSVEAPYLNGEIVLLGRTHGVPTPVNETLAHAAVESARLGRAPDEALLDRLTERVEAAVEAAG
ncbi:ketopantoate reductase family protein [Saccharothrix australiensis]|uniref:2-dehydropantoate 2-reductase n=1 Tax=Saccharothrix australiensis TaxID=2072 RepID=A0A495VZ54_9PSEU|nr:2-dehydropantoate 2-reductase N-terminal domain-containing protein [Saccharothrix australiensis]RKT54636.1 2-dehydropantoate 2-reductase [Saccharothrix australiensis]